MPVVVRGPTDERTRMDADEGLAEGLGRSSYELVTADQVRAARPNVDQCADASCFQAVAVKTSAAALIRAVITNERGDYQIELEVIDGASGSVQGTKSATCELCGGAELRAKMADLSAALVSEAEIKAPAGVLTIRSTPTDATVFVDDQRVGTTPLDLEVEPGDHRVRIEKRGFLPRNHDVSPAAGAREGIQVDLEPIAAPAKTTEAKSDGRLMRTLGWAGLGTGIAALGGGVAMIVLDERPIEYKRDLKPYNCAGDNVDADGDCKYRYNTLAGGVVLTVIGVGLVATGVALVIVGNKRRGGSKARARVGPAPMGVEVRF